MEFKKHVITGAQCTGKTTLVNALKKIGFSIIEESARVIIEDQNRKGGSLVPWKNMHAFQIEVTAMQQNIEANIIQGIHFLDRGIIDNFAYCDWRKIEHPKELTIAAQNVSYDLVFLLQPLAHYKNEAVRLETRKDQELLHSLIEKAYLSHGYTPILVPPVSVDQRIDIILKNIKSV